MISPRKRIPALGGLAAVVIGIGIVVAGCGESESRPEKPVVERSAPPAVDERPSGRAEKPSREPERSREPARKRSRPDEGRGYSPAGQRQMDELVRKLRKQGIDVSKVRPKQRGGNPDPQALKQELERRINGQRSP